MRSAFQMFKDAVSKITATPNTFLTIIALPAAIAVVASFIEPGIEIDGSYIWNSSTHVYQYAAVLFVFVAASLFMAIAATLVADNKELGAGEAYNMALKKALPYVGMVIISTLVLIVAFILLIVPGLWLSVSLMFASYFLVLHNSAPVESLKMSYRLVKGRWWRVLGKSLMFGLLYVAIAIPVFILLWILGNYVGGDVSYAIESVLSVVGSLVTIMFMYELFLDLERTQVGTVQTMPTKTDVPVIPPAVV